MPEQTAGIAEMLARNKSSAAAPRDLASSHMQPARSDPVSVSSYKTAKRATPNLLSHRESANSGTSTADTGAGSAPISPGASAAIAVGVVLFVIALAALGLRNTGKSWKGRNGGRRTDEEAATAREHSIDTGSGGDDARSPQAAPRATDTAIRKQLHPQVERWPLGRGPEPSNGRRPQLAPTRNTCPSAAQKEEGLHVAVARGEAAGDGDGPELRHPTPITPSGGCGSDISALLDTDGGGGVILPPVLTPGWCPTPPPGVGAVPSSYFAAQPASCWIHGDGDGHISHDIAPFQGQEDVVGGEQRREQERRERLAELTRLQGEVGVGAGAKRH